MQSQRGLVLAHNWVYSIQLKNWKVKVGLRYVGSKIELISKLIDASWKQQENVGSFFSLSIGTTAVQSVDIFCILLSSTSTTQELGTL